MHKKIIQQATHEQVINFANEVMEMLKSKDERLYKVAEDLFYQDVYGCHFNEWKLEQALSKMINEDGSTGGHWSLQETNSVAKQYNIVFDTFNQYDFNYVMNMLYADYYGVINSVDTYVRLADKFLHDKDSPQGKALKYYMAMEK